MLTVVNEEENSAVGFEDLTETARKRTVFWIVTNVASKSGMQVLKPCCLLRNNCLGLSIPGRGKGQRFPKKIHSRH